MKNKIILNSLWLLVDKGIILIGGIVTTLIVAKYLNPADMGKINYGIMLAAICSVFSQWGANFTVFEYSASDKLKAQSMVKHTLLIRIIIYLVSWALTSIYVFYINTYTDALFISLICLTSIFLSLDIYQYYFDGALKSSFNTKATFIGRLLSIISRLLIVYLNLSLWYFLIPFILEGAFIYFLKMKFFNGELVKLDGKVKKNIAQFFKMGFLITLYAFLTLIYDKVNVILINKLLSFHELGIFTMTKTLSMAWTFLPLSFGTSIITKELKNKTGNYLALTYLVVILISLPVITFLSFFSKEIIHILLGENYSDSALYLPWLSFLAVFSCLTILTNRVIFSLPQGRKKLLVKALLLTVIGVISSYYGIINYGIEGAIISAALVLFFDIFVINLVLYPQYFKMVTVNIFIIPIKTITNKKN